MRSVQYKFINSSSRYCIQRIFVNFQNSNVKIPYSSLWYMELLTRKIIFLKKGFSYFCCSIFCQGGTVILITNTLTLSLGIQECIVKLLICKSIKNYTTQCTIQCKKLIVSTGPATLRIVHYK